MRPDFCYPISKDVRVLDTNIFRVLDYNIFDSNIFGISFRSVHGVPGSIIYYNYVLRKFLVDTTLFLLFGL